MKAESPSAPYSVRALNELTFELLDKYSDVKTALEQGSRARAFVNSWSNDWRQEEIENLALIVVLGHSRRFEDARLDEQRIKELFCLACGVILAYAGARGGHASCSHDHIVTLLRPESSPTGFNHFARSDLRFISYAVKFLRECVENSAGTRAINAIVMRVFAIPTWFFAGSDFALRAVKRTPSLEPAVYQIAGAYVTVDKRLHDIESGDRTAAGENAALQNVLLWHYARTLVRYGLIEILLIVDRASEASNLQEHLTVVERILELVASCLRRQAIRLTLVPLMESVQLLTSLASSQTLKKYSHFFVSRLTDLYNLESVITAGKLIRAGDTRMAKLTRLGGLQRMAFAALKRAESEQMTEEGDATKFWRRVRDAPMHLLGNAQKLREWLAEAPAEVVRQVAREFLSVEKLEHIEAAQKEQAEEPAEATKGLVDAMMYQHEQEVDWVKRVAESAIVPTEKLLWGDMLDEEEDQDEEESPLALPVLAQQFYSLSDFLMTNFDLYRLRAFHEVRKDLELAIWQVKPRRSRTSKLADTLLGPAPDIVVESLEAGVDYTDPNRNLDWQGSATDPISRFEGRSTYAALVKASSVVHAVDSLDIVGEILVDLDPVTRDVTSWDAAVGTDQIIYLCCLGGVAKRYDSTDPGAAEGFPFAFRHPSQFAEAYNILLVRTCKIVAVSVEEDSPLRKYTVNFESTQFSEDLRQIAAGLLPDNAYECFNLVIRRKPETNTYSRHLSTMKELLLETEDLENYLPPEFRQPILGYVGEENHQPIDNAADGKLDQLLAQSRPGFQYTSSQKTAIATALQPGLTLIAGPPGTGKTDVAVQIVSLLHDAAAENHKTLLIARSNHALNDFFTKIAHFGVDPRHLLRLGMGEAGLRITSARNEREEFSAEGRVQLIETEKEEALAEIRELAQAFGVPEALTEDCCGCLKMRDFYFADRFAFLENLCAKLPNPQGLSIDEVTSAPVWRSMLEAHPASAEFVENAVKRWMQRKRQQASTEGSEPGRIIVDCSAWELCWPGDSLVLNAATPDGESAYRAEKARVLARFEAIEEFYPFELMRSTYEKNQYMSMVHANIVAMTSTRALSTRAQLVASGFEFSTIIIEEAAQLLEIEAVLSAFLQNNARKVLRRIVLLGDHLQLGPIVQHRQLRDRCQLGRSLFARLVALKYPRLCWLEEQGRMRPELADVWRLKRYSAHPVRDMEHVADLSARQNAGFLYSVQCIDSSEHGEESSPYPRHYVNQNEVEWCLSIFAYMRAHGYAAADVTVLTSYSAQRDLCRKRFAQLAQQNAWLGEPARVATIDEYQGQQNDYVILSLVRSRRVGHIAEEGRAVVALSRARLGLYIVAHEPLFRATPIGAMYLAPLWKPSPAGYGKSPLATDAGEVRSAAQLFEAVKKLIVQKQESVDEQLAPITGPC